MGTITLPTYRSQQINRPAGGPPRPDLQGLANLGAAQNRFMNTLFGAGDFAAKLIGDAKKQERSDSMSELMTKYEAWKTNKLRDMETHPISTRDPRFQEIPDGEKALPNLSDFSRQRTDFLGALTGEISDPVVREAFGKWSGDRWISEQDSVARWDFGKTKELRFSNFADDFQQAVDAGDVNLTRDLATAALGDGTIDESQYNKYLDLAHKDITKQGIQMKVAGMDELSGREFLTDPANLKYQSHTGEIKDMPGADQAGLLKWFTEDLTVRRQMQERADKVQTSGVDNQMGTALINLLEGKQGGLNLDMIQNGQWPEVNAGEKKKEWQTTLRTAVDSLKDGADQSWDDSDGYRPLAAKVYAFDRKKDPVSASDLSNEIVRAANNHRITPAHMASLLQGIQLDPDPIRSTLMNDAGKLFPTDKDSLANNPENVKRNADSAADMERFLNSKKAQTMTPQQLQEGAQRILDFNKNQYITDKLNTWYGSTQTQGKILGIAGQRNESATAFATAMAEVPAIDEAVDAGDKAALATKNKLHALAMDNFLNTGKRIKAVDSTSAQIRLKDDKGVWWTPVYDPQSQQTTWKYLDTGHGTGTWR